MKVCFAIPNMGYTDPKAYDNRLLWAMRMGARSERDREYAFYTKTVGKILTPYAREMLAESAVNDGMDLMFMADDDMLGDPDCFFQLAESVVRGPADICGALAFTRNPPHDPVLYTCIEGYDPVERKPYFINRPVLRYRKDALNEVDAVGFGAVVFKVSLLSRMKRPWFMTTSATGEDIFFCYKAKKEAGARVYADCRVKLGHVGLPIIVTEETYETMNELTARVARDGVERDTANYRERAAEPWEVMR